MGMNDTCEYAAPGGICTGHIDVLCVHQSLTKRDESQPDLKRLKECYCLYPDVAVDRETEQAVRELAAGLNAWKGTE